MPLGSSSAAPVISPGPSSNNRRIAMKFVGPDCGWGIANWGRAGCEEPDFFLGTTRPSCAGGGCRGGRFSAGGIVHARDGCYEDRRERTAVWRLGLYRVHVFVPAPSVSSIRRSVGCFAGRVHYIRIGVGIYNVVPGDF